VSEDRVICKHCGHEIKMCNGRWEHKRVRVDNEGRAIVRNGFFVCGCGCINPEPEESV